LGVKPDDADVEYRVIRSLTRHVSWRCGLVMMQIRRFIFSMHQSSVKTVLLSSLIHASSSHRLCAGALWVGSFLKFNDYISGNLMATLKDSVNANSIYNILIYQQQICTRKKTFLF